MGSGVSCSGSHVARRAEQANRGTSAGKNTKDVQCRRLPMCLGQTESVLSTISTAVSTPSKTSRFLCSLSELSHCTANPGCQHYGFVQVVLLCMDDV